MLNKIVKKKHFLRFKKKTINWLKFPATNHLIKNFYTNPFATIEKNHKSTQTPDESTN